MNKMIPANGKIHNDSSTRSVTYCFKERAVSSVSAMPEGLPDLLPSRQAFLDLLRYLIDLRDRGGKEPVVTTVAAASDVPEDVQGAVLFDRFGCRSCHDDQRWQTLTGGSVSADRAPLLHEVGARFRPGELARYLADPHASKPGTRMPNLLASEPEHQREQIAVELTHYLLSRGEQVHQPTPSDPELAARGQEIFHRVGCVACHSPRDGEGRERLPDSSVSLEGVPKRWRLKSLVAFLEDPTSVRPGGRMPDMQLAHDEAEVLAHYLVDSGAAAEASPQWSVEAELARAGEGTTGGSAAARAMRPRLRPPSVWCRFARGIEDVSRATAADGRCTRSPMSSDGC